MLHHELLRQLHSTLLRSQGPQQHTTPAHHKQRFNPSLGLSSEDALDICQLSL
jgi:hypothetical protein